MTTHHMVTDMLSNLGWRSLELWRYDLRIAVFYKIVYGLVAISVHPYFERPMVDMPPSSCLQADPHFCQLLLLLILPNDGYSLE